jgi:hypothetical protein
LEKGLNLVVSETLCKWFWTIILATGLQTVSLIG